MSYDIVLIRHDGTFIKTVMSTNNPIEATYTTHKLYLKHGAAYTFGGLAGFHLGQMVDGTFHPAIQRQTMEQLV